MPEVETIAEALRPVVRGRVIVSATVLCGRVSRGRQREIEMAVAGTRIVELRRHGKNLLFELDRGILLVHLGMTGKLLIGQADRFERARFELDGGQALVYSDVRRFGRIESAEALPERVAELGPDAASVGFDEFWIRLQGRRTRLKPLLLDQRFVRGMGNIYTDEALFRARLHPLMVAGELTKRQARALHREMVGLLLEAIGLRGSSISDYVDHEGRQGSFQLRHQVYGKAGEPCPRCGTALERFVVQQRGTHICPRCQGLLL